MRHSYSDIKRNIKEQILLYSIIPDDELGQCFICDYWIVMEEINYANINKNDVVLEIGPGIGTLTEFLAQRANKVIAIEKDLQFKDMLLELQKKYNNIDIIYADALNIDFPKFNKVVSNLPFKIALPLVFKILEYNFDVAVVICQERLARRICAKPGQKGYSRLSVQISRVSDTNFLKVIPPSAFYPSPKVASAMIKLKKISSKFKVPSEEFFKEILKFLFAMRENTLQEAISILVKVGIPYSRVKKVKNSIGKYILRKPIYTISPREFGKITWILWEEFGESIVKYFYKFYEQRNLYKKRDKQ